MYIPQMQFPLLKLPPWFGGQMGVPGSSNPEGLRTNPQATVIYVDSGHPQANDNAPGTDPRAPKLTIQSAVSSTLLEPGSIIDVSPGNYAESVVTPDYVTGPNYITIRGSGNSRYSPYWTSGATTTPCLDMRAVGWRVENIRFGAPTTSGCIELRHTDSGANDIAIRTIIQNCYFDGLTVGRYGIISHGCYDVWIVNNTFALFHNAVAGGAVPLYVGATPLTIPYRNYVVGNLFHDSDNGAIFPCNGSFIWQNMFQPVGYAYSMTEVLNTSVGGNPGDDNVVWGNVFPGDYSVVGGYVAGAADVWIGNWAEDIAEPEVADNGLTIARPA